MPFFVLNILTKTIYYDTLKTDGRLIKKAREKGVIKFLKKV